MAAGGPGVADDEMVEIVAVDHKMKGAYGGWEVGWVMTVDGVSGETNASCD